MGHQCHLKNQNQYLNGKLLKYIKSCFELQLQLKCTISYAQNSKKWHHSWPLFLLFTPSLHIENVPFSAIRTGTSRLKGEHAYHLTTTTAHALKIICIGFLRVSFGPKSQRLSASCLCCTFFSKTFRSKMNKNLKFKSDCQSANFPAFQNFGNLQTASRRQSRLKTLSRDKKSKFNFSKEGK